jgi:DNA-binding MltR family transcriptional regulator
MAAKDSTNQRKEWDKLASDFQPKSDRAVAVVGTVYLEAHLGQLLANFLVDNAAAKTKLLDQEQPLGSFSARIKAAYSLGLVSVNEYHDLNLMLEIRNIFANEVEGASFNDDIIRDRCLRFKLPREVLLPGETHTPRHLFVFTSTILTQHLAMRTEQASRERRNSPDDFMLIDVDH